MQICTQYTNHNSMADDNQMLFNLRYAKYLILLRNKASHNEAVKKYHKYTFLYIEFARNTERKKKYQKEKGKKCH